MIDLDKEKDELAKARAVSNKITNLGFGDAIRKKVAQYADVRDDVRASQALKRKRNDANDIRKDYVQSYVPDSGNLGQTYFPLGDGMTLIKNGAHQPNFVLIFSNYVVIIGIFFLLIIFQKNRWKRGRMSAVGPLPLGSKQSSGGGFIDVVPVAGAPRLLGGPAVGA